MVSGCRFLPPSPSAPNGLMGVLREGLMLTPQGFQTAEARLNGTGSIARLHGIWEILRDTGCGVMAGIIYGWLQ